MARTVEVDPVDALSIEQAAAAIRHVVRVSTLRVALDVGEILFNTIFLGDLDLVRYRGRKHASFNRLAARHDVGLSKTNLWRCVAIYELAQRIPLIGTSAHLGVTHVRAVLGLPVSAQRALLEHADAARLDAGWLQREASARRCGRGGRPPKPPLLRAIETLMKVTAIPVDALADDDVARELSDEDRETALEMLKDLNVRIRAVRHVICQSARRPRHRQ